MPGWVGSKSSGKRLQGFFWFLAWSLGTISDENWQSRILAEKSYFRENRIIVFFRFLKKWGFLLKKRFFDPKSKICFLQFVWIVIALIVTKFQISRSKNAILVNFSNFEKNRENEVFLTFHQHWSKDFSDFCSEVSSEVPEKNDGARFCRKNLNHSKKLWIIQKMDTKVVQGLKKSVGSKSSGKRL